MPPKPIAFIGDIHLSHTIWESHRTITGDSGLALSEIAEACVREDVGALVLAGDIFDNTDPHPGLVRMFREFVETMKQHDIPVHFIQGNHDRRVVPWPSAVTPDTSYFGDGVPVEIEGVRMVGLDYGPRDKISESLAEIGARQDRYDVIVLHQFAKQYLSAEGCWNLDLEWVPDNVGDVIMGDIHEPWSAEVGAHRCWYTGAPQTRSITEARHPKSILIRHPNGDITRSPLRYRPIRSIAVDSENLESVISETRNWIAEHKNPPLPPVVYVTHDTDASAAPDILLDLFKNLGVDGFVVARSMLSASAMAPGAVALSAASDIPTVQELADTVLKPGDPARDLLMSVISGAPGKSGVTAVIEHERQRFLQHSE